MKNNRFCACRSIAVLRTGAKKKDTQSSSSPSSVNNVRHISWAQEPGQGQPCPHRFARLSAALFNYRHDANVILVDRHHTPVRGQPHRLRSHQRHSRGRAQHLLLDPFDVRPEESVQEEDWQRGAVSGHRKFRGQIARSQIVQILSVGVLLPFLSGNLFD